MSSSVPSEPKERTVFGHPTGLYVLFLTEMWERMSYYGMRALLVLYMTNHLFASPGVAENVVGFDALRRALPDADPAWQERLASQVYGLYTGFVYFTPFFGGMLADRVIGARRSVFLGGTLMMIGHFLMASERLFFFALFFLVLGNGAFKPNISSQVGSLYREGDQRRDQAFTIFYMGINAGALLAPLVCGTLGQKVGWHYGFASAGVGMAISMLVYGFGGRYVVVRSATGPARVADETPGERIGDRRVVVALVAVSLLSVLFWAAYEQQGNTLQLWADQRTRWDVLGFVIPSSWYQSMNPAFILALTPALGALWQRRAARGTEWSTMRKMAVGCFILGLAFFVMIAAARVVPEGTRGSIGWLFVATLILTTGELFLSPIGLSLISRTAPVRLVSTLMGVWFLSSFFGNVLAGYLGTFYSRVSKDQFFALLAGVAGLAGLAIFLLEKPLERALAKRHHETV